jgi:hypothetical protein
MSRPSHQILKIAPLPKRCENLLGFGIFFQIDEQSRIILLQRFIVRLNFRQALSQGRRFGISSLLFEEICKIQQGLDIAGVGLQRNAIEPLGFRRIALLQQNAKVQIDLGI